MNIVSLYEYDVNNYNYIQLIEKVKGNLIVPRLRLGNKNNDPFQYKR
jgi:hypothetical protein